MKLNSDFAFYDMEGGKVLVPTGKCAEKYHGIVRLNDTAAFIVGCLKTDTTREAVFDALDGKYEATSEQFDSAIDTTLAKLRECGALIE
jgi:hypothetical protein